MEISTISTEDLAPSDSADMKCAPGRQFENGSCIPLEPLIEYVKAYNSEHDDPIELVSNDETLDPDKYKKYLVKSLKEKMTMCTNQSCWLSVPFIDKINKVTREELKKKMLRPVGPSGRFDWLNTLNINDVMAQYEDAHKKFKFLGAVPIDFDEIPRLGISTLDLNTLKANEKTKIGIVFNLDESYKSGSHWVGAYCDLENGRVYYYDSYGTAPEKRIQKLLKRFESMCKNLGKSNTVVTHNKTRHQYGNSECGVFSMDFIIRLLEGETFEEVCVKKKPSDKTINQKRNVYFSNARIPKN